MREIKFRAWDKEYKKMMEWGKQLKGLTQNGIKTVISYNSEGGWSDCYNLKDIDLMQYTGLKDKNGKDIYEGDIVKCLEVTSTDIREYVSDVYWDNCYFGVHESDKCDVDLGLFDNTELVFKCPLTEIEVIGNIYENPELLEVV